MIHYELDIHHVTIFDTFETRKCFLTVFMKFFIQSYGDHSIIDRLIHFYIGYHVAMTEIYNPIFLNFNDLEIARKNKLKKKDLHNNMCSFETK